MASDLERRPADDAELPPMFSEDRGIRTIQTVSLGEYIEFGQIIQAYQRTHPDTLIRTTARLDRISGLGSFTVTWWQRGTERPR